jgi:hypothetical protein
VIRQVTTIGLVVVGACAVAVSFAGLYGLALLCRFDWRLAALVPVLVDAGAAVAAVAWLAGDVPPAARRYARRLALSLLAVSVAGNACVHLLVAFATSPPWWVVVVLGAVAPAVLAAVIHLTALVRAGGETVAPVEPEVHDAPLGHREMTATEPADGGEEPDAGAALADRLAVAPARLSIAGGAVFVADTEPEDDAAEDEPEVLAKAREMAAAGVGRPTLVKELGLKDHVARQIVAEHKPRQAVAT